MCSARRRVPPEPLLVPKCTPLCQVLFVFIKHRNSLFSPIITHFLCLFYSTNKSAIQTTVGTAFWSAVQTANFAAHPSTVATADQSAYPPAHGPAVATADSSPFQPTFRAALRTAHGSAFDSAIVATQRPALCTAFRAAVWCTDIEAIRTAIESAFEPTSAASDKSSHDSTDLAAFWAAHGAALVASFGPTGWCAYQPAICATQLPALGSAHGDAHWTAYWATF